MEVSFATVSEKLCTRLDWAMEPEDRMGPGLPYFQYYNGSSIDVFAQSSQAISLSDSSGLCLEQSSYKVFQSVEEFRSMLFAHSDPVDAEQVLGLLSNGGEIDPLMGKENIGGGDASAPVTQSASDLDVPKIIPLIPMDVVCKLHSTAKEMAKEGYEAECFHAFVNIRKAVLEDTLLSLGLQKASMEEVQRMTWEELAGKISKWIRAFKAAIRVLYASEKILCNQVFSSVWAEESFLQITKGSFMQFLGFAEGVVISRRSPERLMKVLDMYETMCELRGCIESVFCDDFSVCVREEATRIMARLGDAARGTLSELENAIRRDPSKVAVAGAAIHPLTRYVMNYIRFLVCYTTPVNRLLGDYRSSSSNTVNGEEQGSTAADHLSPLGVELAWLVVLLEYNLDTKSKLYKDLAQSHFFLMNNAHYIVQKVRKSEELASLLGERWIRKQLDRVRVHAMNYGRCAWRKVLGFLREETGARISESGSRVSVKERLKGFNGSFEDVCRVQANWMIPDPELCEELRMSIIEKIISAYRSFVTLNHVHLDSGKLREKYLKYTEEDLERSLLQLFEGRKPLTA